MAAGDDLERALALLRDLDAAPIFEEIAGISSPVNSTGFGSVLELMRARSAEQVPSKAAPRHVSATCRSGCLLEEGPEAAACCVPYPPNGGTGWRSRVTMNAAWAAAPASTNRCQTSWWPNTPGHGSGRLVA